MTYEGWYSIKDKETKQNQTKSKISFTTLCDVIDCCVHFFLFRSRDQNLHFVPIKWAFWRMWRQVSSFSVNFFKIKRDDTFWYANIFLSPTTFLPPLTIYLSLSFYLSIYYSLFIIYLYFCQSIAIFQYFLCLEFLKILFLKMLP